MNLPLHLFLTGPMGCGKSTAIAAALGAALPRCGGFLTTRQRDAQGHATSFFLQSPDGQRREKIIDCASSPVQIDRDVFETLGVELLRQAQPAPFVVLDEIGGFELLCPGFSRALEELLSSDVPCIGVMKGAGPANAMIRRLGLAEEYRLRADALRERMKNDPNTLLYECAPFDPQAIVLARAWADIYVG